MGLGGGGLTQCCRFLCFVVAAFHPKLFIRGAPGTDGKPFWKLRFALAGEGGESVVAARGG